MYLNLHKRTNKTIRDETSRSSILMPERSMSPYTLFYPPDVTQTITVVPPEVDPARSPDFKKRTDARNKKKSYYDDQNVTFSYYHGSNLRTVHKAFKQVTNESGTLNRTHFVAALSALGVTDVDVSNRCFDLFDPRREDCVEYKEVIQALDVILNGTNKTITAQNCFDLFDPTHCGYIIQPCVHEMKERRQEANGINHMMVTALLEIFDQLQKEYDERLRKEWLKKNKKRRPKAKKDDKKGPEPEQKGKDGKGAAQPPAKVAPEMPTFSPKIHLSFEEFSTFFAQDPKLVQSFITHILRTMEQVYIRNSKAVDLGARSSTIQSGTEAAASSEAAPATDRR